MTQRRTISISTAVGCIVLGLVWFVFAPARVGGQTEYVIVSGNSMEPHFQQGDLVLVRAADAYEIGDVVTYQHPQIGPVIHRIIARDGERYIFQGDNNSWRDGYQPAASALIGKEWVRVPGFGSWLAKIRVPRNLAIVAGLIGVVAMSSFSHEQRTQRRGGDREPSTLLRRPLDRAQAREWLKLVGIVALVAGLALAYTLNRPSQRAAQAQATYTQSGQFAYTTSEASGDGIYDRGAATAGEPIFRQVSEGADLSFTYFVAADGSDPGTYSGTWRMLAEVSDVNGWKRTIELQPQTPFSGATLDATATLAFADVQAVIDRVERQTGVDRSQYHLSIVPMIELNGTLAGHTVADTFSPRLEFLVDDLQLQLAAPADIAAAALAPMQTGAVVWPATAANTVPVAAWQMPVDTARTLALVVFGLALATMLLGWLAMTIVFPAGEAGASSASDAGAIEVRAWSDLLELSQRFSAPVEPRGEGSERRFVVETGGLTYAFSEQTSRAQPA